MASLTPMTRRLSSELHEFQEGSKILSSTPSHSSKKTSGILPLNDTLARTKMSRVNGLSREGDSRTRAEYFRTRVKGSCKEAQFPICFAATEFDAAENHQKSLETYLEKLQRQGEQVSSEVESAVSELQDQSNLIQTRKGLQSLEKYTAMLKEDAKSDVYSPSSTARNLPGMTKDSAIEYMKIIKQKKSNLYARKSKTSSLSDEKDSADLYFISVLLSVNIAVFLFEIASPIKNPDNMNLYSLPLMYGAKVNDLVLDGEWWRLVTPMFLHAGLLHIALSSWALLFFGPQVCKGYGAFTFFFIYLLGGISGNFTSFLHTSEPTVGGSGPVFAIIGAWLIYQMQNKDITGKDNVEAMFQKAMITTALSFVLANFGAIDNWTSLGAAVSGVIYGYFTCPVTVMQVDDTSETAYGNSRLKEGMTLSRQPATPCKSLLIFTLFVSALSSLIFLAESPLETLELNELV